MRIGLVLFGHLRSFRSTHDSYKQFLKILQRSGDVDVFCHTWDIEESVTASWWKEHKPGDTPSATVNANEIIEKYRPVKYTIEPSRQFDDAGYDIKSAIPIAGILSTPSPAARGHSPRLARSVLPRAPPPTAP